MFRAIRQRLSGSSAEAPKKILLPPFERLSAPDGYLAVVTIFKSEGRYLKEWLEFQKAIGVDHVYLYDNGSTDNSLDVLQPFAASGAVTVIPWNLPWYLGATTAQSVAFAHALMTFGHLWQWMGFLDVDEFLFTPTSPSLPDALRAYEEFPAIAAFWVMFGSNGHQVPPDGPVLENFTQRAPFPTHAKSKCIVRPEKIAGVEGPHLFHLVGGLRAAYTERRQLYEGEADPAPDAIGNVFRLNHYFTRSRAGFEEKIAKKRAVGLDWRKLSRIADMLEAAPVEDRSILEFKREAAFR